ncbi:MAG: methyltransferase domain-containing protein [Chloroflexi bacterium]|nr:methyltransferase domain-containing protein [Chloroflexota bacterium]
MTPSETYAACLDAVQAQNARIYGPPTTGDPWGGAAARQFRFDPRREPDRNLAIIASYVRPDDVVVDVGGGAGRVCLPLALRCKEVLNIEPSPGMAAEFESLAQEAGINNARLVPASLAESQSPRGDIAFTADVTYFVRDINTFIRQLEAAASRRVMITIWSEPPPNRRAKLFQLVYGEEQAVLPGQAQLLPVLWEMGILPDVQVLPEPPWWENQRPPNREEAVKLVLEDRVVKPEDRERARPLIESHFDELFAPSEAGFVPQWLTEMREVLITWETGT